MRALGISAAPAPGERIELRGGDGPRLASTVIPQARNRHQAFQLRVRQRSKTGANASISEGRMSYPAATSRQFAVTSTASRQYPSAYFCRRPKLAAVVKRALRHSSARVAPLSAGRCRSLFVTSWPVSGCY